MQENKNDAPPAAVDPAASPIGKEFTRIQRRREKTGLDPASEERGNWGLALSGGGIRSATCSLGVLQALALSFRTPAPRISTEPDERDGCVLREFDYLSSVSGGGYIASFFTSLFVPKRLKATSTAQEAAATAYEVLRYEPPARIHRNESLKDAHPGKGPMSWLRENGRYLAPTGGGDMMYAVALAMRNWLAVMYVLGTLLIAVLALLGLIRIALALWCRGYPELERQLLLVATTDDAIWWSTVWAIPVAWLLVRFAPCCVAYWLTHPQKTGGSDADKPRPFSAAAVCALVLGAVLVVLAVLAGWKDFGGWSLLPWLLGILAAVALLAFATHVTSAYRVLKLDEKGRSPSIAAHRLYSTRALTSALMAVIATSIIALADTLGQQLYLLATRPDSGLLAQLTPGALIAALVWVVRRVASFMDEKEKSGWMKLLPTNLLLGAGGMLLLLLIVTLCALLVQWLQWMGSAPQTESIKSLARFIMLSGIFLVFLGLAIAAARFSGFLNLSTLQMLYGARLTRAYLGASNGKRYANPSCDADRSVAEPIAGDQITHEDYYHDDVLAPVHLINVTLNQTIDPAEQLVQRDRKGRPVAVGPSGFSVDGAHHALDKEKTQHLTIGQWVGISGAAFTTGLGRSTSLGASLLLGLSNVRLGMWWQSGHGVDKSKDGEKFFKAVFRTQTFLMYELLAKFHGMRREWQYLSDGGHYENTAAYELLRPERKVRFMVVCDNGCDPRYQFGDLANLIRLARIDYQVEIEVDAAITGAGELGRYFGLPEDFQSPALEGNPEKCAMLLRAYRRHGGEGRQLVNTIVLLKPRLLASMPVDVREYQLTHPAFPQEPTADQFFDEAQWESYRQLGFSIGRRIFGTGSGEVGAQLWSYLKLQA